MDASPQVKDAGRTHRTWVGGQVVFIGLRVGAGQETKSTTSCINLGSEYVLQPQRRCCRDLGKFLLVPNPKTLLQRGPSIAQNVSNGTKYNPPYTWGD